MRSLRSTLCRISNNLRLLKNHCSTLGSPTLKTGNLPTRNYEEMKISVPWGHIAGKWYGPKHVRPILAIHGWQDNAGTFDTLIPLLPSDMSFLCIDLPGHGLSSWLPEGITYHSIDYVMLMRRLMDHFQWDKLSLMAHSMSSINAFIFSALFPSKVDLVIGLDVLKPLVRSAPKIVDSYGERIETTIKIDKRLRSKSEPPCYDWGQLVDRLHTGTEKSVDIDSCKYLLERNIKSSSVEENKYYFSRDSRLKSSFFFTFSQEVVLEMACRIKCPYLFIKAKQSPYYERREYYDEALQILKSNPLFEYQEVEGTHHVHLNQPERISPVINSFITKTRLKFLI